MKRLDTKVRVGVSADQDAWLKRQADVRSKSVAAIVRDLIEAEMRKEAQP